MGRLHVILGCMFSQKTTELISLIRRYKSIQYEVLVVNYIADTRYGEECIGSHNKETERAVCRKTMESLDATVRSGKYRVIAIDEGQFFTDLYEYVTKWADELPITIIIAGLDGSSKREPMGDMLRLIPHAEDVTRLHAFCSVCLDGTIANYSKYFGEEIKGPIKIGAGDCYRPVCRRHYLTDTENSLGHVLDKENMNQYL